MWCSGQEPPHVVENNSIRITYMVRCTGGIESVECSTGMEWWNGIVEWPFSPLMNNLRGGGGEEGAKR